MNPNVTEIPEISFHSKNTKAGAYKIGQNMVMYDSLTQFIPDDSQIRAFEKEKRLPDFQYKGKGIFYSSYKRGIYDKLLFFAQLLDMRGIFIDWCMPGDRRIWFDSWKINEATVVGIRMNDTIDSFNYMGYKFGFVYHGKIGLQKAIKLNASIFPTLIKWIYQISIIAYFCCSEFINKYDLLGTICLVVSALFGWFLPSNLFENVVVSLICSFLTLFIKFLEIYDNNFKGKYIIMCIKAFQEHDNSIKAFNNLLNDSNRSNETLIIDIDDKTVSDDEVFS